MLNGRYSEPAYAARYLEAEWGDLLLRHARFTRGHGAPFAFQDNNIGFYTQVVRMIQHQLPQPPEFELKRIGDFGCATGRLVRELCQGFPNVSEVHGYEPSTLLVSWARQLLTGEEPLSARIPCTDQPSGSMLEAEATPELRAALQTTAALHAARIIHLSVASAETAHVSPGHFDLVTCLNVLDRHPNPPRLVQALRTHVRCGGYLCISSPLEWEAETTPSTFWRDSVAAFLSPEQWQILAQADVPYQFRLSNRYRVQYASQVVLAQRRV